MILSIVAVALLLTVAFAVATLGSRGDVEVKLGDDTFGGQKAESLAATIDRTGPILFPDVAGGRRDIVLQHIGDDPERGWLAFAARPAGTPRDCTIQWNADDQVFRLLDSNGEVSGPCDGTEFPADGGSLPSYPVGVRDGRLDVDLNAEARATSTTR